MTRRLLVLMALASGVGCTEHVQLGDDSIPGLVSLEVTPHDAMLSLVSLDAPAQQIAFTVSGQFVDGTTRDVTDLVHWSVDDDHAGAISRTGLYITSGRAAGHVLVTAASGSIADDARVTIAITATIVDGAFPPPAGTEDLFATGTPLAGDPVHAPRLLYPADATLFPQGLARILFQTSRGSGNDAVRLTFESDVLHLTVFTGADRWQPDDATWQLIEHSHRGASTTLTVAAASSAVPGTFYVGDSEQLRYARGAPGGAIYFSSQQTSALMRGQLGSTSASKVFPQATDTTCVGCHAISRDGSRMVAGYGGEMLRTFDLVGLTSSAPMPPAPMGWAAFAPDGASLVTADKGVLTMRDAATVSPIGPNMGKIDLGAGMRATHPDWSPDGSLLAVTLGPMTDQNMDVKSGSIALLPFTGGAFGPPQVIVATAGGMDNNYFPKWSPDGRYLAYVHADSGSKGAKSAELRIVPAAGGTPVALGLASHRVGMLDGVVDLANTMPSWAPMITDGIGWLSFASARPYGAVRPMAGPSQIWIAGIDLGVTSGDPSAAAFWLPCQDSTVISNNPVWAAMPLPND